MYMTICLYVSTVYVCTCMHACVCVCVCVCACTLCTHAVHTPGNLKFFADAAAGEALPLVAFTASLRAV